MYSEWHNIANLVNVEYTSKLPKSSQSVEPARRWYVPMVCTQKCVIKTVSYYSYYSTNSPPPPPPPCSVVTEPVVECYLDLHNTQV